MSCWGRVDSLMPCRSAVYTHGLSVIAFARLVLSFVIIGRHVPIATHNIIDVLAVPGSIGTSAGTNTEFFVAHEGGPLMILKIVAKGATIEKCTDWVAIVIGTMRIVLSSTISSRNINLCEIALAGDLNVVRCLDEMDTLKCTIWNEASATATLSAISNATLFTVSNSCLLRRSPKAEVLDGVDPCSLAFGRLAVARSAAVCAVLAGLTGVRELVVHIPNGPNLVRVRTRAIPDLRLGTIRKVAVGQVNAFAVVSPSKVVVTPRSVIPLLVLVSTSTFPDLKFLAVGVLAVWNI
jgi:hypothetical protein